MYITDVEEILLGKFICTPDLIDKYSELLHKDLFQTSFNRSVYEAMIKLNERNEKHNFYTLYTKRRTRKNL